QIPGSAIYFSVDFDASASDLNDNVAPYFQGIRRAFAEESGGTSDYRIGAYGSGFVCTSLTQKGLAEFIWLAMSRGFRGTSEALSAGQFHLAQRAPAQTLCGLDVDFNDSNPAKPDFGAFVIQGDTSPDGQGAMSGERFKVIARSGLRLR